MRGIERLFNKKKKLKNKTSLILVGVFKPSGYET